MHRARCACTPTRTAHAHLIATIPPNVARDLQFASAELHIAIAASFFVEIMRAIAFTAICTVFYMAIGNLGCVAPQTKILGVGQPKVDFCSIMRINMRVHAILTVYVWVLLDVVFRFTLAE